MCVCGGGGTIDTVLEDQRRSNENRRNKLLSTGNVSPNVSRSLRWFINFHGYADGKSECATCAKVHSASFKRVKSCSHFLRTNTRACGARVLSRAFYSALTSARGPSGPYVKLHTLKITPYRYFYTHRVYTVRYRTDACPIKRFE